MTSHLNFTSSLSDTSLLIAGRLCCAEQACAVLGSSDASHYSLLSWLPGKSANSRSSARGSVGSSTAPAPKQASAQLSQLACEDIQQLADDIDCYERVRELGFVRGVLLPVRNALGDAARVGALLEEGPGPYNTGARQVCMRSLWTAQQSCSSASWSALGRSATRQHHGRY